MKKLIALALSLVMALTLAACGANSGSDSTGNSSGTASTPAGSSQTSADPDLFTDWRIGTSSIGGNFYTMGSAVAQMLSEKYGYRATAQATNGAIENVTLLQNKDIDIGMLQSTTENDAVLGRNTFEGSPVTGLRMVANFYISTYHVLVRTGSGIKSFEDMKGKNIAVGPMGGGVESNTNWLLHQFGIEPDEYTSLYSTASEQFDMMKDGTADVTISGTGMGSANIQDALATGKCYLLSIDEDKLNEIIEDNSPYYMESVIPANFYPNQEEDIHCVAGSAMFCCWEDMDDAAVYDFLDKLFAQNEYLVGFNQLFTQCTPENGPKCAAAPLHPGAEKWYKEHGIL